MDTPGPVAKNLKRVMNILGAPLPLPSFPPFPSPRGGEGFHAAHTDAAQSFFDMLSRGVGRYRHRMGRVPPHKHGAGRLPAHWA